MNIDKAHEFICEIEILANLLSYTTRKSKSKIHPRLAIYNHNGGTKAIIAYYKDSDEFEIFDWRLGTSKFFKTTNGLRKNIIKLL